MICLGGSFNFSLTVRVVNRISKNLIIALSTSACSSNISKMLESLPHFATGEIVRGFGRGSKDLGIPTANYPLDVVKALPPEFMTGVYYGWASVDNSEVHKMVMSVGWNPFYENKEKSMETHILHKFNRDLYGSILKVCIIGYIRQERNFDSLDALISTINDDIHQADVLLDKPENQHLKTLNFFKEDTSTSSTVDCNGKSNGHV